MRLIKPVSLRRTNFQESGSNLLRNRLIELIHTSKDGVFLNAARARLEQAMADRLTMRLDGRPRGHVAPIKLIKDVA